MKTLENFIPYLEIEDKGIFPSKVTLYRAEFIADSLGRKKMFDDIFKLINSNKIPFTQIAIAEVNQKIRKIFIKYHNDGEIFLNSRELFGEDFT